MNTSVKIAGVEFKNPVMTGSGTFGSGMEYGEFVDLNKLGAVVTKGVANVPWPGNPTPRIAEVYGGMLNAIGLQNPGIDVFMERDIPFLPITSILFMLGKWQISGRCSLPKSKYTSLSVAEALRMTCAPCGPAGNVMASPVWRVTSLSWSCTAAVPEMM